MEKFSRLVGEKKNRIGKTGEKLRIGKGWRDDQATLYRGGPLGELM